MLGLIYLIAARHRRELLKRERAAASEMVRAYGLAWERIRGEIDQLTRAYYEAVNAGEALTESWMYQNGRLMQLRAQIEQELARIAMDATPAIRAQQLAAVQSAGQHAREMVTAASPATVAPVFTMLPNEAMTDLVGFLRNGSPLRILLDELGPMASQGVQDALIQGVALGYNPRKVARLARKAMGGNMARALRISRTEMMRCYREATHRNYQENNDVVVGWMWMAARDRACLMCLAMDGTMHRLSERLDDHPNGRCVPVPKLRGEAMPEYETGKQWFEKLDPTAKQELLGKAGFEAYQSGTIKLEDFIGRRRSREWGTTRYAKSVKSIIK